MTRRTLMEQLRRPFTALMLLGAAGLLVVSIAFILVPALKGSSRQPAAVIRPQTPTADPSPSVEVTPDPAPVIAAPVGQSAAGTEPFSALCLLVQRYIGAPGQARELCKTITEAQQHYARGDLHGESDAIREIVHRLGDLTGKVLTPASAGDLITRVDALPGIGVPSPGG